MLPPPVCLTKGLWRGAGERFRFFFVEAPVTPGSPGGRADRQASGARVDGSHLGAERRHRARCVARVDGARGSWASCVRDAAGGFCVVVC